MFTCNSGKETETLIQWFQRYKTTTTTKKQTQIIDLFDCALSDAPLAQQWTSSSPHQTVTPRSWRGAAA